MIKSMLDGANIQNCGDSNEISVSSTKINALFCCWLAYTNLANWLIYFFSNHMNRKI